MPDISDPTTIRTPEPEPYGATVVRPPAVTAIPKATAPAPNATDETLVRGSTAASQALVTSGTAGFAAETRLLLRKRLIVTHCAIGTVTAMVTVLTLAGAPVLPCDAGLGRWSVGLPLLACGQCIAGLVFLLRYTDATLHALRVIEVTQFGTLALGGGIARFAVLTAPPATSPDPRFHDLLYRFDAIVTSFPLIFAVLLYGVLIPNTRRRSLIGTAVLCIVPLVATGLAAALNPHVRDNEMTQIIPTTVLPLFMAGVIAVFSASRATALQRQAYDAIREAQQLGAYTLVKKLGEGGMGEVWLAEHRLLKRPCAIKFIRAELAAEPSTAARFEREVRAVTTLTHFNTVRIYDYGRSDDGSFYYVMEFLDGPTLDQLVKSRGSLAPGRAVYLLRQLCGALAEAHTAGMVHRDLKPGNILVATLGGQRDVAKLLDFGLVQDHSATASDDRITRAGTVLGTPSYMCPEQAAGESVDPRSDIYSLGAVAFFMLAGRPPFEGSTVGKLLAAHLTQPAPAIDSIRSDIPSDLAAVVAKCLAKDPKDRFQSVTEMEESLAACACAADWSACIAAKWWAPPAITPGGETTEPDCNATVIHT